MCDRLCEQIPSYQSELVDLHIECLQLSRADLLCFISEHLICLQINSEPLHLHFPSGIQPVVWLCHS